MNNNSPPKLTPIKKIPYDIKIFSTLAIFSSQLASSSLFSRLDAKKTQAVKSIRKKPKKAPYEFEINKNKATKNKIDLTNTWYLKTAKIEKA